nr:FAD-dependent oxidoreductase [Armatimonas sp.]
MTTNMTSLFYWKPPTGTQKSHTRYADLCVYGGTASGVSAAVQAARLGLHVLLIAPERHIGGLTAGGLSYTDTGRKEAIGGLAREVYARIGAKYGKAEEWNFEPHIAQEVLTELLAEVRVVPYFGRFLASVKKSRGRIISLTTEEGLTVEAAAFIDATYEGDLMAKAGVSYTVGRESNKTYGETLNGVQVRDKHQFLKPVSPYVSEGDPKSGLLPGIQSHTLPAGSGDKSVQAYCFRLCLTKTPANKVPYPKPEGYEVGDYELLRRYIKAGANEFFNKFDPLQKGKFDKNNHGGFSTDFIGANHKYPEASYAEREKIFQAHVRYQQGLMWYMGNEPSIPLELRERWSEWGLCRDEFVETGGWPWQLYIREARRMVTDTVMTEKHCKGKLKVEDSVGLGSYNMDSHNCNRVVVEGFVKNEGDVQTSTPPYAISYRSIVPRERECRNLFVPVCLASSHIAYGSIRMEPVFMILGQSSALAAWLFIEGGFASVQEVPYALLESALRQAKQVLAWRA